MADRSRGLKLLATGESVNVHVTLNRAGRQRPARFDAVPVKLSLSGDLAVTRTVVFTSPRLTATTPTDRWFDIDTPCSGCYATAENVPIAALSRSAHVVVSCRGTDARSAATRLRPTTGGSTWQRRWEAVISSRAPWWRWRSPLAGRSESWCATQSGGEPGRSGRSYARRPARAGHGDARDARPVIT